MFLERKLNNWAENIRQNMDLPLRVELWNGRQINLGNKEPQVTIRVLHISAVPYLLKPSLANLGSAYVEGKIDLEGDSGALVTIGNALAAGVLKPAGKYARLVRHTTNNQKKNREAIQYHYDVSNDFYHLWLDKNMVYSCAYFEHGDEDLETAQIKKIDHILKKIQLRPGNTLLDIGCGWGALVLRAAQEYGAKCVGVTLSKNQEAWAKKRVFEAGLADRIDIRLQDYRDIGNTTFDRITSVGMFEHVGLANLSDYFSKMNSLLAEDGIALNHGITSTDSNNGETPYGNGEFIENYVFPRGQLPHIGTVLKSMQEGGLEAWDVENLRRHYIETCLTWSKNFEANSDQIRKIAGEKRYRIWRLYLAGCAYAFRQDWISLYQVVCVKSGKNPANLLPRSRNYMYPPDFKMLIL